MIILLVEKTNLKEVNLIFKKNCIEFITINNIRYLTKLLNEFDKWLIIEEDFEKQFEKIKKFIPCLFCF